MLYRDAEIRKRKQYKLAKEGKAIWHIHKNGDIVAFCGIYDFWVPKVGQKDGAKGTCKNCVKWFKYYKAKGRIK